MKESIQFNDIEAFQSAYKSNPRRKLIQNAIIKSGITSIAQNNEAVIAMKHLYSTEISTGDITAQKHSGRCWMFAALNSLRINLIDKLNLKNFEFSQNFPMFWDKLEKANWFLENIIETADKNIYDRTVMWLLRSPLQDGGQWDMFISILKIYGSAPQNVMPETHHSSNTAMMNFLITLKLRENASILRDAAEKGASLENLRLTKAQMLEEIYRMLAHFLGEPPTTFDFEYKDKDKNYHCDTGLTPVSFFKKYVETELEDYVSIINAPTKDKPFLKTYTVEYLGNITGGQPIKYLNLSNEALKELALKQLQDGEPVWFGCDVGKWLQRDLGIMDTAVYNYEDVLETCFGLDKAGRLDYGVSQLTHAMVFLGVNIADGKPNRWKVENSWGDKIGDDGFCIMSDDWFNNFNYQVVINKKYLSPEQLEALQLPPVVLPAWDPMGSLALMR
ncbi:MAG: C1 family peptidase [Candidatus Cloacimonetes bacterium]|nr:C1 family peptidase [Candidatus Cloacimonadota bacterium]